MMKKWISSELHTHTIHSDGRHSLLQLAEAAKMQGIECICITDHNTISAYSEVEEVKEKTGMKIIKGMELTTFYGHVLCMGLSKYVDWRDLNEDNIHLAVERVHKQGALIGAAHPFQDGSPIITGGKWQYKVSNWNDFDYLEVWHESFPAYQRENVRSYKLWNELLNKGYKITGVNGIDWHRVDTEERDIPVTYLGIDDEKDENNESAALKAIKAGSVSVTMGPLLLMSLTLKNDDREYQIGDTVQLQSEIENIKVNISINYDVRKSHWNLTSEEAYISIMSNKGELKKVIIDTKVTENSLEIPACGLSWIRAELHGSIKNINKMIAFTNQIYFK